MNVGTTDGGFLPAKLGMKLEPVQTNFATPRTSYARQPLFNAWSGTVQRDGLDRSSTNTPYQCSCSTHLVLIIEPQ
jgi:hypothetical protein